MRIYFSVKAGMERDSFPAERRKDVLDVVNRMCDEVAGLPATTYIKAASNFDKAQRIFAKAIDAYDFVLAPTLPMA